MSEELKDRLRLLPERTYPMPVMLALFEEALNRIEELEGKLDEIKRLYLLQMEAYRIVCDDNGVQQGPWEAYLQAGDDVENYIKRITGIDDA